MTDVIPLKHLARINQRVLPASADPDREIRYIDIGSVGRGKLVKQPEQMRFADAPSRARRLVRDGDTIVSTVRTYLRAVWPISGDTDDLVVSTGFAVLSPTDVDPRYFSWWVHSDTFIEEVVARSVGVSYPAINASELGNLRVRVPSLADQRAIADYLDTETSCIDTLIAKKRRMIELLEERLRRTALGLLTGEGQGPSWRPGPYWLGSVPRAWKPRKIAWEKKTASGTTPTAGNSVYYNDSSGVPWITTSELRETTIVDSDTRVTTAAFEDYSALKVFPAGTILVAMYGATVGRLGVLGMPAATNQACCAVYGSGSLDQQFLYWWLWANRGPLVSMAYGSGQPNISQELIRGLRVPAPDAEEQRQIADRIEREAAGTKRATARLSRLVELLAERRQALITAAVTGELAVPGVAACIRQEKDFELRTTALGRRGFVANN